MADQRIFYPHTPPLSTVQYPSKNNLAKANTAGTIPFGQILEKQLDTVKFSQHALQRLQSRNIKIDDADMAKLSSAVEKAAQKGAKESLVLMNNLALVVSVKNRTVITAMDESSMKDNVFTNIDSAVIV